MMRPAPRADDWVAEPLYLGLGALHSVREDTSAEPPRLWLPTPGQGDGWTARAVGAARRPLGFRRRPDA